MNVHTFKRTLIATAVSAAYGPLAHATTYANDAYDFNYQALGAQRPSAIFDDGAQTYFQTAASVSGAYCDVGGGKIPLALNRIGPYSALPALCEKYYLELDHGEIEVVYTGNAKNARIKSGKASISSAGISVASNDTAAGGTVPSAPVFEEFMPLRHVLHVGQPASVVANAKSIRDVNLMSAIGHIVPSDFVGMAGREVYAKSLKVSHPASARWYEALETVLADAGLFAEIDWNQRVVIISANPRNLAAWRALAARLAATTVTPSPVKAVTSYGSSSTKAMTASVAIPPSNVGIKASVKPEDGDIDVDGLFTDDGGVQLIKNDTLSKVIKQYVGSKGYQVLWQTSADMRIKRDTVIDPSYSKDMGKMLTLLLRPAGMKAVINHYDKTVLISEVS